MSVATPGSLRVTYNSETTELRRTVGTLFIGYVLSMVLYGFNSYQMYIYFSTVLKEHYMKRWVVGILGLLDSASVGLMTHVVHCYMVSQFPVAIPAVEEATGTFCADNIVAVVSIFLVQFAYSKRVHKYSTTLAAILAVMALAAVCLGVVMSIQLIKERDFNGLNGVAYLSVIGTCQAVTFAVAALTFVIFLFSEEPVSPSKATLAKHYDRIVSVAFEKGAAPAVIQAGYLILFFAAPTDRFWIPFQFIARRLFFLSLLTLYINDGVRERRCVTLSPNTRHGVSSASEFSAAANSSESKPPNISSYPPRDARSETTFVQKGHAKGSPVFNISVTREVIEDSGAFPGK